MTKRQKTQADPNELTRCIRLFAKDLRDIDFAETGEITARLRAARRRFPEGSAERRSWEAIGRLLPVEVAGWWRRLRDPLKARGRPPKAWPQRRDADLIPDMLVLVLGGVPRTTAARYLLQGRGVKISLKSRADNLVRLFNKQHPSAL